MSAAAAEPPPEAQLIRRSREALGLSPEQAAERLKIKMSARRWRQIEDGFETRGGKPAPAGDMQLAHMAHVVNMSPEELEQVDRPEAAEILRRMLHLEETTAGSAEDREAREARAQRLEEYGYALLAEARELRGETSRDPQSNEQK